ncbi:hypothetical protein GALL_309430 [mine drainage metagenome]|uniref:Uncharacterized protein n=1 Tax=mine drainage metagenome TaxID=410659 RepID=A0A1J5QUQ3_9ZZZZ
MPPPGEGRYNRAIHWPVGINCPNVFNSERMVFESVRFIPTSLARATSTDRTRWLS